MDYFLHNCRLLEYYLRLATIEGYNLFESSYISIGKTCKLMFFPLLKHVDKKCDVKCGEWCTNFYFV